MGGIGDKRCEVIDPLRLDRCPDCGYLLTGLPEEGICPECGFAYQADMIVLYGWARGHQVNQANTRGWGSKFWRLFSYMCGLYVLLPAVLSFARRDWRGIWPAVLAVSIVAYGIARRLRRDPEAPSAPVQVRLCPQGYAQRDGIGPVKLRQWRRNMRIELRRSGSDMYRVSHRLSFWRGLIWPYGTVDMEFECSQRIADKIVSKVNTWRKGLCVSR